MPRWRGLVKASHEQPGMDMREPEAPVVSARFAALLFLVGGACVGGSARRDPVERALRQADALRGTARDAAGRDAALQRYLELAEQHPDDHRVLARVSRALVLDGMLRPDAAARSWQAAREYGLHCLRTGAGFSGQVSAAGGRLTAAAIARIPPEHAGCAAWTAEAWARQAALRGGPGVALDLPAIQGLARRAADMPGSGVGPGQVQATLGLALVLTPTVLMEPETDARSEARAAFEAALAVAPERLLPRVDLAEYVLLPNGEHEAARSLLASVAAAADADEPGSDDTWAVTRAVALLDDL